MAHHRTLPQHVVVNGPKNLVIFVSLFLLIALSFSTTSSAADPPPLSDFESSISRLNDVYRNPSSAAYTRPLICWYGISDDPNNPCNQPPLLESSLPDYSPAPAPTTPTTPAPGGLTSYQKKMQPPPPPPPVSTDGPRFLVLKGLPPNVPMNTPFTFGVQLLSGTPSNPGSLLTNVPPFDVRLSVERAEVKGAELSSWIVYDIKLGGQKTSTLAYGSALFKDVTLNVGSTLVWFKVEAVNPPQSIYDMRLSVISPQSLEVLLPIKPAETGKEQLVYLDESTSTFVTSKLNLDQNRYDVDAHALQLMKDKQSEVSGNFGRAMLMIDHYSRADCDAGLTPTPLSTLDSPTSRMYTLHYAVDECYVSGDLRSSSKLVYIDSLKVTSQYFPASTTCTPPPPNADRSDDVVTTNYFTNQCVSVPFGGSGRSRIFKYVEPRGPCKSSFDPKSGPGGEVVPVPNPVVRVREWSRSWTTRDPALPTFLDDECSQRAEQPLIKTYGLNVCYADPSSVGGTFKFTGCSRGGKSALANQYPNDHCAGPATQRRFPVAPAACFVAEPSAWGVGAGDGNDFAVECGVVC